MVAIILNSLSMACFDYSDRDTTTSRNKAIEYIGFVFTGLFLIEAVLKIIGMGFMVNKKSYLRDPWNCIDFVIVVAG